MLSLSLKKEGRPHKKIVPYDILIGLSWNSQGLGRPGKTKFLKEMLSERKVKFYWYTRDQ
jgi:hypothetical protein